ncbi:hypothetical protein EDC30_11845 [Paucimonas lemoignei]|uniref:Uncharacterized protein n=1 Tax=Paucimonas lemoignei TaxID=29443 RepID=A0A4R3HPQ9_PAULE|nr:hypothetical protein [Paucimonas lemoignei]TCS33104.1 hypothetical protein EDC30_11845 [Paucimonas lemoignei]
MTASTLERMRAEVVLGFANWRQRLLTPEALAKLAKDLGLGWFSAAEITGLWKIGLLRADLVMSDGPIDDWGLSRIEGVSEGFEYTYCDFRRISDRPEGYGSALLNHEKGPLENSLAFHPFRVYVLHHVKRTLRIGTSSMQYLVYQPGISNVVQHLQEGAQRWTSSIEFGERFHYWNQIVETAAVVEPVTYDIVFRDREPQPIGAPPSGDFEHSLRDMLVASGKIVLRAMRSDLAFAAETLDENRSVHVLLRLMKWRERERLKGQLGCAMYFLAMAETIRRAAEQAFAEAWPEEDEIGPGQWFPGARKMLYGNERVFDAPRRDLRDYLTQLGLDFGVKVRCYVEGDTEYGALVHAVGSFDHVQLINLSGSVAEKRGRGLAFVESLEADMKLGIFSVVVLDGDREEYLRMLRKAADEGRFHGRFFISQPDMECGNFSASELIETAIHEYQKNNPSVIDVTLARTALLAQASKVRNNGDLFSLFKEQGLTPLRKSESWGKALMELAITNPAFPVGDAREGQKRSIVEVAELLLRMQNVGFSRSVAVERLDSSSGRIVPLTRTERS